MLIYIKIRGVGHSFFFSPLPLIFCAHFSLPLTKNINIFMAKNIANINIDILSAQKSMWALKILILILIKISIKRARTLLSAQNIDKRAKKSGPLFCSLFLLIFLAVRSLVCSFYWAVHSFYQYFINILRAQRAFECSKYQYFKYFIFLCIFLWQFLKWEPIFALSLKMAVRSWVPLKISIFWAEAPPLIKIWAASCMHL